MNGPKRAGDVLHLNPDDLIIIRSMRVALVAVLVSLLASCASSGFYNMSDSWCVAHPGASLARCPQKSEERRVAVNDGKQLADSDGVPED